MASKYVKLGSLIVSKRQDGSDNISIGLGQKGKNAQYNLTVELVVKDATGKVVARQTDGFINLTDPRTEADDLLKIGLIDEEKAAVMRENAKKLSDKVKYILKVPRL